MGLQKAVDAKKHLQSLQGRMLTAADLSAVLHDVRRICAFPMCPDKVDQEYSPSLLDQEIEKITSNRGDPDKLSFSLLFLRLEPDTFTIMKADTNDAALCVLT